LITKAWANPRPDSASFTIPLTLTCANNPAQATKMQNAIASAIFTIERLQRNIPVFLFRQIRHFFLEHFECLDKFFSGIFRTNYLINIAALCCRVWISKKLGVLFLFFGPFCSFIGRLFNFFFEDDGVGNIRLYYLVGAGTKRYTNTTLGAVNYVTGRITLNDINITSATNNEITITIKPESNDVVSVRSQLALIAEDQITVNAVVDKVASGETSGGSNYIFTSSRS
jgi:hypothetical protein